MDEPTFLTFILLINHRIPHVLVAFYECRFLAKNEGQSHPLIQGAQVLSNQSIITWNGGPPVKQTDITEA